MNKSSKRFTFEIGTTLDLSADDIWPDGDAPDEPTVDDVLAVIKQCGGARRILSDWDLDRDIDITVSDDKDSKVAP
jgi:hypothetical protein